LNESHHLFVKLSCKSACENLDVLYMLFATNTAAVIVVIAGTPEQQSGRGAVKELRAMETCKKQKFVTNYACFCAATTLTSKIKAEIIENHSGFYGYANICNKFVSSRC